jgi:NADH:ubiquinone oxidoreductase subunit 3 (subunit A)
MNHPNHPTLHQMLPVLLVFAVMLGILVYVFIKQGLNEIKQSAIDYSYVKPLDSKEFPIRDDQGSLLKQLWPFLLFINFMIMTFLVFSSKLSLNNVTIVGGILTGIWFIFLLAIVYVLKPKIVLIEQQRVDIYPVPILGLVSSGIYTIPMSSFSRLEAYSATGYYGQSYGIKFIRKDGSKPLLIRAPASANRHEFIRQLAQALNLEVSDNA